MKRRKPPPIRIEGNLAYIELTHGLEAVIDACDVPLVEGIVWYAVKPTETLHYASGRKDGRPVLMHRVLMKTPKELCVDHIDHNGLNNRRGNLRHCSHGQNMINRVALQRNKLGAKGVTKRNEKYRVHIKPDGKTIFIGSFDTMEEARAAYWGAARALWGDFACA